MKNIYLINWPNGSSSMVTAKNQIELFDILDEEGDPSCAEIIILPKKFHISFNPKRGKVVTRSEDWENSLEEMERFNFVGDVFAMSLGLIQNKN